VRFQKIPIRSIPTLWRVIGNSKRGEGRAQKPKCLKKSMNQNWNFQRDWGRFKPKTLHGRGMDIFCNNTLSNANIQHSEGLKLFFASSSLNDTEL